MVVVGYLAAIVMGSVLGLIGGGGSILTVPILVYLFDLAPEVATGYSLLVVGLAALVGGLQYHRRGLVDFRTGIIFAIPAFLGVYLTRRFGVPALPDIITTIGDFQLTKDILILLVFAVVMIMASVSMIRGRKDSTGEADKQLNYALVGLEGLIVGGVTGFVGAGGGFLIIPALVVLAGLEMKTAVGTSLIIIAFKSTLGFIGDLNAGLEADWAFLGMFTAFSIVGIFVGNAFSTKVPSEKLKPGFGWFVLVMGLWLIWKQI